MYGRAVACLKLKFNIMFCFNRIRSFAAIRMNTMSTLSTQHRELDHETYNSNLSNRNRDFKIFAFSAFKKIAKYFSDNLNPNFITPFVPKNYMSSWAQYSLILKNKKERGRVIKLLNEHKIPSMIYYKIPLHLQKVFKYLNYKIGDMPESEKIANNILSLPMHPYLEIHEQEFIISKLNSIKY